MKFTIFAALLSFVSIVAARSCAEADRFGDVTVSKTTVNLGDTITVNVDLTCSVQHFGFNVKALDYTLEVLPPNNSGFESPVILARHCSIAPGALSDSITATIPTTSLNTSAPYNLVVTNIHGITPDVVVSGGVLIPITINA